MTTTTEREEERGQNDHQLYLGIDKRSLVRLAVCVFTLWLIVLLLGLLVVVGMYTSQANQILVVSSVAVISTALVVATCKINSITAMSKMVAEEIAAKSDPPPTYDDVLHSEAPPPSYYSVVSEAAGGNSDSGSSPAGPVFTHDKGGTDGRPEDSQPSKQTSSPGNRSSPALRRWLGRPGILHSVMFRASRRPSATTSPTRPVKVPGGRDLSLRRSSSTPSLAGLAAPPPVARCPSTPSLCDPCGCF